jgi:YVTN family beta-propeller protein
VTPIDTATNTAGTPIPVGSGPEGVAITPDGRTAYVTNFSSGSVTPIDTATNTPGTPIPVGSGPEGVAITPDGRTAYVANSGSNTVTPIDAATNTARAAIPIGELTVPSEVAITPDGRTAYVTNVGSDSVTPIDTATNTPGRAIPLGSAPDGVAITPDGRTAYVTSFGSGSVIPIDTATNTPGAAIPVVAPSGGVAVTPDQPPVAAFSATAARVGQVARFDASGSSDPDGTIASYRWDFGDGTSATTSRATITHAYARAGSYTVTVRETDAAGCSTARMFTGQTVSCNGSPVAQSSYRLRISAATRVRIARLHATPLRPGCVVETGTDQREITAPTAGATCRRLRLSVSGTIQTAGRLASSAAGTVRLSYAVRFPGGLASGTSHATVHHGRWRISLILPAINLDPLPPLYVITVQYNDDRTHQPASAHDRIRLEGERAGL